MLQQIGLYYPYIHFRDDAWLKTAALYWPKMARVVPAGYPLADSDTVRTLSDELDFVVAVEPTSAAQAVAPMFLAVVGEHSDALRRRYQHTSWQGDDNGPFFIDPSGWPTAGMYWDEVAPNLQRTLFQCGLADYGTYPYPHRTRRWIAMHPALAWVYKCALTEEISKQSQFAPTTDQVAAHTASNGWDSERIAQALLDVGPSTAATSGNLIDTVGLMAVRIVVPVNLDEVSPKKIAKLRLRHKAEFDAFKTAVTETAAELTSELADVSLPVARERYMQMEVERRFEIPLRNLEKAMKGMKVDSAYSAANLKFDLPTTVASLGGGALAGQPLLGTTAAVAFALAGLRRTVSVNRQDRLTASPVAAYLLSVERGLEPPSLLRRIMHSVN
ncbi:DUF6236 family protein [Streptomyces diastatochromogenes]|uniref:DUF6236 family protein n=1 Tax=Streptomyces diastatochromogenes TaxID=42236 RepID=UPI003695F9DB